jgi:hypothetical protein
MDMNDEIGVKEDSDSGKDKNEYKARYASHMDVFYWVKRDSYLAHGSQGLKVLLTIIITSHHNINYYIMIRK